MDVHSNQEVLDFMKKNFKESLSYNLINRTHFFLNALHEPDILESMLIKLELVPADKIPYLLPGSGIHAKGQNAFIRLI